MAVELPSQEPTFEAASSPCWACNFRKGRCDEMMRAMNGLKERRVGGISEVEIESRARASDVEANANSCPSGRRCGAHSDPDSRGQAETTAESDRGLLATLSVLSRKTGSPPVTPIIRLGQMSATRLRDGITSLTHRGWLGAWLGQSPCRAGWGGCEALVAGLWFRWLAGPTPGTDCVDRCTRWLAGWPTDWLTG